MHVVYVKSYVHSSSALSSALPADLERGSTSSSSDVPFRRRSVQLRRVRNCGSGGVLVLVQIMLMLHNGGLASLGGGRARHSHRSGRGLAGIASRDSCTRAILKAVSSRCTVSTSSAERLDPSHSRARLRRRLSLLTLDIMSLARQRAADSLSLHAVSGGVQKHQKPGKWFPKQRHRQPDMSRNV